MTDTVALGEASLLAACEGLTTVQLNEAVNAALLILGTGPTPTATITVPVAVPVTVPVAVPVQVIVPVGAPGTGGGTGPETGIIAMAAAGGIALAGGSVLLARRLRRK
jgi:LPXTG-motif cell wall-anchored protein